MKNWNGVTTRHVQPAMRWQAAPGSAREEEAGGPPIRTLMATAADDAPASPIATLYLCRKQCRQLGKATDFVVRCPGQPFAPLAITIAPHHPHAEG